MRGLHVFRNHSSHTACRFAPCFMECRHQGRLNKLYETGLNCFGGGVGVLFIVLSSFRRWKASSSWPAPAPSISAYYLCIAVAYRNGHVVRLYHHARHGGPAPDVVFMLLFGHEMPLAGWLGILCLCAGVLGLTRDNIKNGSSTSTARWPWEPPS